MKFGSSSKRFFRLAVMIAIVLMVALLVMRFEIKRREQSYRVWQQEHFSEDHDPGKPDLSKK
jgi:flagellar biogenesis protein FliO